MTKLIKYYFKNRLPVLISLTVIFTLIFFVAININERFYFGMANGVMLTKAILGNYSTPFGIALGLIAIYEFSFKMRKRSIDQEYSFPITRSKLYLSKLIFGYLEVVIPFSIAFFLSSTVLFFQDQLYVFGYIYLYYLLALITGAFFYSICAFIFCQQNTLVDGIVMVGVSIIFVSAIYHDVITIIDLFKVELIEYSYFGLSFRPLDLITVICNDLMGNEEVFINGMDIASLALFSSLGIASAIGLILKVPYDKAEKTNQVSDTWFGYRVVIPVLGISASLLRTQYVFFAVIIVSTYLLYVAYKRKFNFDKKQWIIFTIVVICEIITFILNDSRYWVLNS